MRIDPWAGPPPAKELTMDEAERMITEMYAYKQRITVRPLPPEGKAQVRTPAGERRFGQPIGSVIVADALRTGAPHVPRKARAPYKSLRAGLGGLGLDDERVQRIDRHLRSLYERYGRQPDRVVDGSLYDTQLGGPAIAFIDPQPDGTVNLGVTPAQLTSEHLARLGREHYTTYDTIEGAITHEYAHLLDGVDAYDVADDNDLRNAKDRQIFEDIALKHFNGDVRAFITARVGISTYARTNPFEARAEEFAFYMGGSPDRPPWLVEMYERRDREIWHVEPVKARGLVDLSDIALHGHPSGTGTLDDPIDVGDDLDSAVMLLSEGKHVRLDQPDQVATLIEKIADVVNAAKARGEMPPDINLCGVSVRNTNLFCHEHKGIPRVRMPQLIAIFDPDSPAAAYALPKKPGKPQKADITPAFIEALQERGIKMTTTTILASHLRATQDELVGSTVAGIMRRMDAGDASMRDEPIFVTKDGYIIDGHHRWAVKIVMDSRDNKLDSMMNVHVLDMDIGAAIDFANEFATAMGMGRSQGFAKKTRYVRTPEGQRVFDQPIGSVIRPDVVSNVVSDLVQEAPTPPLIIRKPRDLSLPAPALTFPGFDGSAAGRLAEHQWSEHQPKIYILAYNMLNNTEQSRDGDRDPGRSMTMWNHLLYEIGRFEEEMEERGWRKAVPVRDHDRLATQYLVDVGQAGNDAVEKTTGVRRPPFTAEDIPEGLRPRMAAGDGTGWPSRDYIKQFGFRPPMEDIKRRVSTVSSPEDIEAVTIWNDERKLRPYNYNGTRSRAYRTEMWKEWQSDYGRPFDIPNAEDFIKIGDSMETTTPSEALMTTSVVSREVADAVQGEWDSLKVDYPRGVIGVDFASVKYAGFAANYRDTANLITFNGASFQDDRWAGWEDSVDSGFHPPGSDTPASVLDHEFGHHLYMSVLNGDQQIELFRRVDAYLAETDDVRVGIGGPAGKLEIGRGPWSSKLYSKMVHQYWARVIGDDVSRYAMENDLEFIAEAFAEYRTAATGRFPPRPLAKLVGEYIDSIVKGPGK